VGDQNETLYTVDSVDVNISQREKRRDGGNNKTIEKGKRKYNIIPYTDNTGNPPTK
jgi:hypothetical protein